jgi:hypothetical protein
MRALPVVIAVLALMSTPCLLIMAVNIDGPAERVGRLIRRCLRWLLAPGRRAFRRLARAVRLDRPGRLSRSGRRPTAPVVADCPPIERVAADLRRLGRQRYGVALRSPVWQQAVQRAYDERLRQACRQLDIEEHLVEVASIDLELERIRVQAALTAAGLVLEDRDLGHWQDQR